MKKDKVSVIICAGGSGTRAKLGKNKLLADLYGAPVLWHTLKKFDIPQVDEVVVASSETDFEEISAIAAPFGCKVVLGGNTRSESVRCALAEVSGEIVLIHDGARPFVSKDLIISCIDGVKHYGSAVCAMPATDTAVYGHYSVITERLDRSHLYRIQTPQGFYTDDIKYAYDLAGDKSFGDDSEVYGEYIGTPRLIDGEPSNLKLTYKQDFDKAIPRVSLAGGIRSGFGCDVHAFGEGTCVTLCGVKIECGKSLIAHSDGDVAVHAVMDALLSAAGLEDIGHYFPDTDPAYKNADSMRLLEKVVSILKERGFAPSNISLSIQAEKPKLAPYISEMKKNLAQICKIEAERIAIAAGTCEGLGFVGEGLGIAAYAVATLIEE
ncbi:MAG: 2-C-methyl-D-erythritol 2,4-cyclodiphosphate synthase [Clostridia bacterium]|nr:2-C-methyl-D-erythritol 2,4-cyclodiphosphate synthase [Clostridia bacterium]